MAFRPYDESGKCLKLNLGGVPYEEFSCLYPTLGMFYYQPIETTYDPVPIRDWMRRNPQVPIITVMLYGAMIYYGRSYFSKRESMKLKLPLAAWNFTLSLFSLVGTLRLVPQFVHNLSYLSIREVLCMDPESTFASGSTGMWTQFFVLSKFPELFDTFFIVVNKKPLMFLHWYHHITVLLYSWFAYIQNAPSSVFFVTMNFGVHALMYGYYFFSSFKIKIISPLLVTALQISQMFVGVTVTVLAFYFYNTTEWQDANSCYIRRENNIQAFAMYGSYLFLFVQFFVGRYMKKNK
mmetsp:Transcript_28626/g.43994  ORF Transcript_28626/g.43994 Transcript_28626/m.43994 type:complete len:293 (-) Transcript_28626:38-916(-)